MQNATPFDIKHSHIQTILTVKNKLGQEVNFRAIVDTGAPFTEISDRSLARAGYELTHASVETKDLQETQKYSKIHLLETTPIWIRQHSWSVPLLNMQ